MCLSVGDYVGVCIYIYLYTYIYINVPLYFIMYFVFGILKTTVAVISTFSKKETLLLILHVC